MDCQHPEEERYFSDDLLFEWCGICGQMVKDHHERKYGNPHPDFSAARSAAATALGSVKTPRQTSVQITAATDQQVELLKQVGFGSFTDIVRIAIDRMAQQEANTMSKTDKFGRIQQGTDVTFRDGKPGKVINSNTSRVLVEYPAIGGGFDIQWFDNDEVKIK